MEQESGCRAIRSSLAGSQISGATVFSGSPYNAIGDRQTGSRLPPRKNKNNRGEKWDVHRQYLAWKGKHRESSLLPQGPGETFLPACQNSVYLSPSTNVGPIEQPQGILRLAATAEQELSRAPNALRLFDSAANPVLRFNASLPEEKPALPVAIAGAQARSANQKLLQNKVLVLKLPATNSLEQEGNKRRRLLPLAALSGSAYREVPQDWDGFKPHDSLKQQAKMPPISSSQSWDGRIASGRNADKTIMHDRQHLSSAEHDKQSQPAALPATWQAPSFLHESCDFSGGNKAQSAESYKGSQPGKAYPAGSPCRTQLPGLNPASGPVYRATQLEEGMQLRPPSRQHCQPVHSSREISNDDIPDLVQHAARKLNRESQASNLVMGSLQAEIACLREARLGALKKIQDIYLQKKVLENSERSVLSLVKELDRIKTAVPLTHHKLRDVVELVCNINLARGAEAQGVNSYISNEYGRRCLALPCMGRQKGWLKKLDVTKRYSAVERAFAFAAGCVSAGEVRLEITVGQFKGRVIQLKDVLKLSSSSYQHVFGDYADAITKMATEANMAQMARRNELEEKISFACTEMVCIDHIHHVGDPLHFRAEGAWMYTKAANSVEKDQAVAKARKSLGRSGADLSALVEYWNDRNINLEPIEERTEELKAKVAEQFAKLSSENSRTSPDYSSMLETVRQLKHSMAESSVINSVAVTASNICGLTAWQMSQAMAAAFPHVICYEDLHANGIM